MNRIRRTVLLSVLVLAGAQCAFTQQAVAPPPNPNASSIDSGPSLADTMQFIQDKLNNTGTVNYISCIYNGNDSSACANNYTSYSYEYTKIVANPAACYVGYHLKFGINGKVSIDNDTGFYLRDVENILVMPQEQYLNRKNAANGIDMHATPVDPPTTALVFMLRHNIMSSFTFADSDMADRVAKALQHAVELCTPNKKPEPF